MSRCFDLQQLLAEKNAMGKRSGAAGDDLPPGVHVCVLKRGESLNEMDDFNGENPL